MKKSIGRGTYFDSQRYYFLICSRLINLNIDKGVFSIAASFVEEFNDRVG